jgi:polyisoprenoid-binding protein YceI
MRRLLIVLVLFALALSAADISGTWAASVKLDAGAWTATFVFKQAGEALTGTYSGVLGNADVKGTVKGNQAEWSFENADAGKIAYKGTVEGATIKGTVEYGQLGAGSFTAEKR